jgi:hypothetical protein
LFGIHPPRRLRFSPLKSLIIAAKIFAFLNLLFVPAIAVLLLVAFVSGETWWFAFLGLPALFVNAVVVFARPQRQRIWRKVNRIAGTSLQL